MPLKALPEKKKLTLQHSVYDHLFYLNNITKIYEDEKPTEPQNGCLNLRIIH